MEKVLTYDTDNCYICNNFLGIYRNQVKNTTNFTDRPIYEILGEYFIFIWFFIKCQQTKLTILFFLEIFLECTLPVNMKQNSSICQECFMSIDQFDELQSKATELQNNMVNAYHRAHSEHVYIKEEHNFGYDNDDENASPDVELKCHKCKKSFDNLHEMVTHQHREPAPRRYYAKSKIDPSKISKDFKENAEKVGVNYDYETFQRTFFSENEKIALSKSRINSDVVQLQQTVALDINNRISKEFRQYAQRNGIDYSLETFQKAFGFTENEQANKKQCKKNNQPQPKVQATKKAIPRPPQVAGDFLEFMQGSGIEYNMEAFQRAFGCQESAEMERKIQEHKNKTQDFVSRKLRGFVECDHCESKFTNRHNFMRHLRKEHRSKEIYCEKCDRDFKTIGCLHIHLATDHGRNYGPVACPICQKVSPDKTALRSHMYIHGTERNHFCERCGASFLHKKSFEMHMKMHDDIRDHICHLCDKGFRNSSKLKM